MARLIDAVLCAEKISEAFNIPLGDLVDVFAETPTAEVVPKLKITKKRKCAHNIDSIARTEEDDDICLFNAE